MQKLKIDTKYNKIIKHPKVAIVKVMKTKETTNQKTIQSSRIFRPSEGYKVVPSHPKENGLLDFLRCPMTDKYQATKSTSFNPDTFQIAKHMQNNEVIKK